MGVVSPDGIRSLLETGDIPTLIPVARPTHRGRVHHPA